MATKIAPATPIKLATGATPLPDLSVGASAGGVEMTEAGGVAAEVGASVGVAVGGAGGEARGEALGTGAGVRTGGEATGTGAGTGAALGTGEGTGADLGAGMGAAPGACAEIRESEARKRARIVKWRGELAIFVKFEK